MKTEYSVKELEALLADQKKKEMNAQLKKQKAYENGRDLRIEELINDARELSLSMARFKAKAHAVMNEQNEQINEYGKIRSDSKGGFSITHSDGKNRVTRRRDTDPVWDERAGKAVDLIKNFLSDTIKKRDVELHDILMGFLTKNKKGDLEYASVMELLKYQDSFNDPRWKEGLRLIKESYKLSFKVYSYEFKTKNAAGKWEGLNLNFASV